MTIRHDLSEIEPGLDLSQREFASFFDIGQPCDDRAHETALGLGGLELRDGLHDCDATSAAGHQYRAMRFRCMFHDDVRYISRPEATPAAPGRPPPAPAPSRGTPGPDR